jgi:ferredoxin-NADP reductase
MNSEQFQPAISRLTVSRKIWLSDTVFELSVEKPSGYTFFPGQKVFCEIDGQRREYTLVGSPVENTLSLCIRHVSTGFVSTRLAELNPGDLLSLSDPYGFFLYRPGNSVFVATGTGIAPFAAFGKAGINGFIMLHGVSRVTELYYRKILESAASQYIPCLSSEKEEMVRSNKGFNGRVTGYLQRYLAPGVYNFYLCGNGAMVRDAIAVIDAKFPDSRIFTETFFTSPGA